MIEMAALETLGFGKTMVRKLQSIGIHSVEELVALGSKEAIFRLKAQYSETCVVILYYLEAAIRGVEIKQLDKSCKIELKAYFNQL